MACEYCRDVEPFDAYEFGLTCSDSGSLALGKTTEGGYVLVAGVMQGADFVYFGTKASYCIRCGEKLGGDIR